MSSNTQKRIKKIKIWYWIIGIVLVLLIFIGVLVLSFIKMIDNVEQEKEAISKIYRLSEALEVYHKDLNCYPSTSEGLKALIKQPSTSPTIFWKGSYIETIDDCKDPWGNYYHYKYPGIHYSKSYDLWTFGADNKVGGSGLNKDIGNWDLSF